MTEVRNTAAMEPTVFLVEDDEAVRSAVTLLLDTAGLACRSFPRSQDFLDEYDPQKPGCVVTDIRMPGMSGLDLQEVIAGLEWPLPVIVITGHGDVPAAVRAMKQGALDFLEKPFHDEALLEVVRVAIERDRQARAETTARAEIQARFDALTDREHQVMLGVVAGKPNKIIADELGLSIKTVEFHRANVMHKIGVVSIAELVQRAMLLDLAS